MILEGLVATRNADGSPHLAPMGPHVEGVNFQSFVLRPFPTSQTYNNLLMHQEGVLHVTDDALLIAKAAIGVKGLQITEWHRFYEFKVRSVDNSEPRIRLTCEVVHQGQGTRPWFGFNRARHAVLEAAILATRVHLLPKEQLEAEFRVLQLIVDKTGGDDEKEAMRMLLEHIRRHA